MLPVSSLLTGQLGLSNLYLSLPCILGAGGIQRVLVPTLNTSELAELMASGAVIRAAITVMDAG